MQTGSQKSIKPEHLSCAFSTLTFTSLQHSMKILDKYIFFIKILSCINISEIGYEAYNLLFFVSSYLHLQFLEVEGKYQVPISQHTKTKSIAANTGKTLFATQAIQSFVKQTAHCFKKDLFMKAVKPLLLLIDRKLCKFNM